MPRWVKICLVVLVVLVAGAAAATAYVWANLAEIAMAQASKATGRTVKIGALRLSPGRWIGVELRDASVANLPGGTRPDMATLARLTGEVLLWPLLHGTIVARSVRVEKADILLEKIEQQPNWRNGPKQPEKPDGGRAGFPTLLGATLDGMVTFRTTSGKALVATMDGVTLDAPAADQPVHLSGPGSYQGVPIQLDVKLGSFDQLNDAATALPSDITLTSGDTVLHFVGTMTKPLDVDGADGELSVAAPTPAVLEKVAGADPAPAPPLRIAGAFQHDGELWAMQRAKGALGQAVLNDGTLSLQEGSRATKTPDKVTLDLRFGQIDADRLLAAFKGPEDKSGKSGGSSFVPSAQPNPEISAKLEASGLTYEKFKLASLKLSVAIEPRSLKLDEASFGTLGGQLRLAGQIRAGEDGKAGTLSTTLAATGLEVTGLRQALGMDQLPLAGRMDVHAVAEGTGATAPAALTAGRASLVATMRGGSVSQQVVELASTNPAALFRSSSAMVGLACLLAVAEIRGGVASVGPVRLRSAQGTIVARGQADLLRETLDMVVASESKTTGPLALDIPVRVTGRFSDPSIAPAGAASGRAALAGSAGPLAASLRPYAERSGCAR